MEGGAKFRLIIILGRLLGNAAGRGSPTWLVFCQEQASGEQFVDLPRAQDVLDLPHLPESGCQ